MRLRTGLQAALAYVLLLTIIALGIPARRSERNQQRIIKRPRSFTIANANIDVRDGFRRLP